MEVAGPSGRRASNGFNDEDFDGDFDVGESHESQEAEALRGFMSSGVYMWIVFMFLLLP